MIDLGKRSLLGVGIDAVDIDAAVERISFCAEQRLPYKVSALAAHGVVEATRDAALRAALNDFDLVLPDGQSVRWALDALHHVALPDKVPGPSVVDVLLAWAADHHLSVCFYGSTPAVLDGIRQELLRRHGRDLVVHARPSRFASVDPRELAAIAGWINATGAQLCLVGLGCPRQERFVAAVGGQLNMPTLAVGAAFDYLAGGIQRAPARVQAVGMEWAYRLSQDPRRLAGRYLSTNTAFTIGVVRQLLAARLLQRPAATLPRPARASDDTVIDLADRRSVERIERRNIERVERRGVERVDA